MHILHRLLTIKLAAMYLSDLQIFIEKPHLLHFPAVVLIIGYLCFYTQRVMIVVKRILKRNNFISY